MRQREKSAFIKRSKSMEYADDTTTFISQLQTHFWEMLTEGNPALPFGGTKEKGNLDDRISVKLEQWQRRRSRMENLF